jgi:hypothetical protein
MEARRMRIDPTPGGRADRAAAVLRRAVALARVAARGVAILALASLGTVGLAWVVWVSRRPPTDANDWAARVVVLGIALIPPVVLAIFLAGLRELAELPRRFRELPPDLREQMADARTRAAEPSRVGLVGSVVRLARLLVGARDLLSPYAVITAVLRPALLLAAVVAAALAVVEVPIALVAALLLATT